MVQITQGEFWRELISTQLHKMVERWTSAMRPFQTGGYHEGKGEMPKGQIHAGKNSLQPTD